MKKRMIKNLLACLLVLLTFTTTSCKKNQDKVSSFPEIVNELNSYKLSGTLESNYPSGTKVSNVTVYYKKPDLYRVELVLPNSLEKQVILKNTDGVFVLIPSLNKNFKVSSNWPLTTSYPYLLQSLSKDFIADEEKQVEKTEEFTTYKLKVKLFDNAEDMYQKIIFDNKTGYPKEVCIYKNDDTLVTHFKVDSIDLNIDINSDLFENNKTMETLKDVMTEEALDFDRVMSYPTYCPTGLVLKEEVKTGSGDNQRVLLTYSGSAFITIIEKFITPFESLKTEYTDGDIYVLGGVAAIVNNDTIKFYEAGIEYTIASSNIDKLELAWIGDSLRLNNEK
jgi:outer membrane lipoprotein-sorting protein